MAVQHELPSAMHKPVNILRLLLSTHIVVTQWAVLAGGWGVFVNILSVVRECLRIKCIETLSISACKVVKSYLSRRQFIEN